MSEQPPALIIGAGIAGITAALHLDSQAIPFAWWTGDSQLGGTLLRVGNTLLNYPGGGFTGPALISRLDTQLKHRRLAPTYENRVTQIVNLPGSGFFVSGTKEQRSFSSLILCTGTQPRKLGVPGEERLRGQGVECAVSVNLLRYKNKRVAVVGGGDGAAEGALLLAQHAQHVTLIHRSPMRAQRRFIEAIEAHPRITTLRGEVSAIDRAASALRVMLRAGPQHVVDGVFIRIGVQPTLPVIPGLKLTPSGYVAVDADGRTSLPGLYAAGDVASPTHQSAIWSAGLAAKAADTLGRALGFKP